MKQRRLSGSARIFDTPECEHGSALLEIGEPNSRLSFHAGQIGIQSLKDCPNRSVGDTRMLMVAAV